MRDLYDIYVTQFKVTVAQTTQYRMYLVIWVLSLIAEPIVYMSVWGVVTAEQSGVVEGFTAGQFSAYYITWILVRHFAVALGSDTIEWRVRTGALAPLLMRPIHPLHADIADNWAIKLMTLPVVILTIIGLALAFPPSFQGEWYHFALFIPAVALAFPIRFLFHYTLGMVAFWTTRTQAVFGIFEVAEIFLTGRLAPLALLPGWILVTASVTPFRWMVSFPVEVFLGQLSLGEMAIGFGAQIVWDGLMIWITLVIWRAAVRQFSAVGS
jgi:ABC-2 type transport system permease protein